MVPRTEKTREEKIEDKRDRIKYLRGMIAICQDLIKVHQHELEELERRHCCRDMGLICEENQCGILILDARGEKVPVKYCPICGKKAGE